ncbi:MAG: hypothetical protein PVJ57_15520 [Phycisphaerae bacterium]|jgi:S1-C subfamily serine protease
MFKMSASLLAVAACVVGVASLTVRADGPDLTPAQQVQVLEGLLPGFVRVEFTLKYDQGEAPGSGGWMEHMPNFGFHRSYFDAEEVIREQRPLEAPGYLIGPDRVLVRDPGLHPRFIEKIEVRAGDQVVSAKPAAYTEREPGLVLELAAPLSAAKPFAFDASREGPYFVASYQFSNATWGAGMKSLSGVVVTCDTGLQFRQVDSSTVIVDASGQPVAVTLSGELPLTDAWRGSPADWPACSAEEMEKHLKHVEGIAKQNILHVTLKFRSPRKDSQRDYYRNYDDEEAATEMQTVGILRDERTLLILGTLKPAVTARLERIQVRLADGEEVAAHFGHTLREYGCFVAELEEPLSANLEIAQGDLRELRNRLLVAVEVNVYGEECIMRFLPGRIPSFRVAHKHNIYPELPQREDNLYLFTLAGKLVAAPLEVRAPANTESRWYGRTGPMCTPLTPVVALLADMVANADPSNVPLTEEEESRIAWLGVELQNLDADLARAHGVSDLTQNGSTGAIVSYVYPGSPAEEKGVQPGWVFVRLHPADHPKPVPVRADEDYYGMAFPWDRLDELPEEYYNEIPAPWPSVDNTLTQALTEMGFGRAFQAEFFHDGKKETRDFTVVQSPPYYGTAPRFKSEELGLTVKDLTYEVRRYFRLEEGDPGVIVCKIEPGSRASVAGLKPFEIVTQVNNEPATDAATFGKLISSATEELRLNVKRMARSRVVKIAPAPAKTDEEAKSTTQPAEDTEESGDAEDSEDAGA